MVLCNVYSEVINLVEPINYTINSVNLTKIQNYKNILVNLTIIINFYMKLYN